MEKTFLNYKDHKIPVRVYTERRNGVRCSIGKTAANLRIPNYYNVSQRKETWEWFEDWAVKQFDKNEKLRNRFFGKGYETGDMIYVGERAYRLIMQYEDRASHAAKLKDGDITLKLAKGDEETNLQKAIRHLLSRVVSKDFKQEITEKVQRWNQQYFQKDIKSVNLKYNTSNWGSCSSKGNINLSSRLLFAPDDVIDYVIVHELAHLIEMNHSAKFWKIVSDIMPNYKEKERWLKVNNAKCDF